jgi:hypothetical protein
MFAHSILSGGVDSRAGRPTQVRARWRGRGETYFWFFEIHVGFDRGIFENFVIPSLFYRSGRVHSPKMTCSEPWATLLVTVPLAWCWLMADVFGWVAGS